MEVLSPVPGSTLSYAVIADKVGRLKWFFQLPQKGSRERTFELFRYVRDDSLPPTGRRELLLSNVRRLTFTSLSEGALLMNLTLSEDEAEYSILTSVRLRNLASTEELW